MVIEILQTFLDHISPYEYIFFIHTFKNHADSIFIYWWYDLHSLISFFGKWKTKHSFIYRINWTRYKFIFFKESEFFCHIRLATVASSKETLWRIESSRYEIEYLVILHSESYLREYKISRILKECHKFEEFIYEVLFLVHIRIILLFWIHCFEHKKLHTHW